MSDHRPSRPSDPDVEAATAGRIVPANLTAEHRRNRKQKRRRRRAARAPPEHLLAMSIPEFCRRHDISPSFYWKLQSMGLGPATMTVGNRKLISIEAAAEWRRAREAAALAKQD